MLKANGGRLHTHVNRTQGGNSVSGIYGLGVSSFPSSFIRGTGRQNNFFSGKHSTADVNEKAGMPSGARHPQAWFMPKVAGGLASHNECQGVATASLSLASGRNIAATSDGVATTTGTLQLVVSMTGTAAGQTSSSANLNAALGMAGSTTSTTSTTASITALAWAVGSSAGVASAALTSYATGRLYGAITPFTELSPQSLADAVISAASTTPIHADIRKVNSYTVDGDGQSGSEWGPV